MAQYELKTKRNSASVTDYLNLLEEGQKKQDCLQLLEILRESTGEEPMMWGGSIIGFGKYAYQYPTGQSGEWPITGFSPRKQNISIMIMSGLKKYPELMQKLGKYKTGVSCLYVRKLSDIDMNVFRELLKYSLEDMRKMGSAGA